MTASAYPVNALKPAILIRSILTPYLEEVLTILEGTKFSK